MALNIQKARERLHEKLTRKVSGNKREFPWYKGSVVRDDHIEVTVTDAEKADNTLKPTYYGHTLDIVGQAGTPPSSKEAHTHDETEDGAPSQAPIATPESKAARGPQAADATEEKEEEEEEEEDQDDYEPE